MVKYLQILIGLFLFVLTGCVSKPVQHAAAKAAGSINATKYSVSLGVSASTEKGNYKSYNVELSEFENVPQEFDNERLASIAALAFYKNLTPADYKGYQKVEITIKRSGAEFEKLYDIKQLAEAETQFKPARRLAKSFRDKSFENVLACVDTYYLKSSDMQQIYNYYLRVDSAYGPMRKDMISGFRYTRLEEENIPVVMTFGVLDFDSAIASLKVVTNTTNGKVVSISMR